MHGNVAIILTAHMPYVRTADRHYAGEETLHELVAYSLVPTLSTLFDMCEARLPLRISLAFSPILLEQLADPVVQKHFSFWLDDWLERLEVATQEAIAAGETERLYLARFYRQWAESVRHNFDQRFGRNLVAAIRQLIDTGVIEPLSSTASFARLDRLHQTSTIRAQIELGALACVRAFGQQPQGFWPPDLAYRPEATKSLLAGGINRVVVDPADQYGAQASWIVPQQLAALPFDPYYTPYLSTPNLDYRGDPIYLAPRQNTESLSWWRNGVTNTDEPYDPYHAYGRAQEHAAHFASVLSARLGVVGASTPNIVPIDINLLGNRWFEGAAWFRALLMILVQHETLTLTTPSAFVRASSVLPHPSTLQPAPDTSAFGSESLFLLRHELGVAEATVATMARRYPGARAERERVLHQAARELLLAQSNDLDPAPSAATLDRARHHLSRCAYLCELAEHHSMSEDELTVLETWEEQDNAFPYANYRVFGG